MGVGFSIQWTNILRNPNLLARPEARGLNLTEETAPYFDEAFQALLAGLNEAGADPETLLELQYKAYALQKLVGGGNPVEEKLVEIFAKLGHIDPDLYASALQQMVKAGGGILRFAPSAEMVARLRAGLRGPSLATRFAWTKFPGEYVVVGSFQNPEKAGRNPVILHNRDKMELTRMLVDMQGKEGFISSTMIEPEGTPKRSEPRDLRRAAE